MMYMPTYQLSTIQLENGLTATLRNVEDPALNAVREKWFLGENNTPLEYGYVASIQFGDEIIHILLWVSTSKPCFNQILRELQTNLNAAPNNYCFVGIGYETSQQAHLYFWNKATDPRSKDTKAAKILWKALTKKQNHQSRYY